MKELLIFGVIGFLLYNASRSPTPAPLLTPAGNAGPQPGAQGTGATGTPYGNDFIRPPKVVPVTPYGDDFILLPKPYAPRNCQTIDIGPTWEDTDPRRFGGDPNAVQ